MSGFLWFLAGAAGLFGVVTLICAIYFVRNPPVG